MLIIHKQYDAIPKCRYQRGYAKVAVAEGAIKIDSLNNFSPHFITHKSKYFSIHDVVKILLDCEVINDILKHMDVFRSLAIIKAFLTMYHQRIVIDSKFFAYAMHISPHSELSEIKAKFNQSFFLSRTEQTLTKFRCFEENHNIH